MFSKENLETTYGNLEVEIFHFSLRSKCLFLVLWTLAILSNLFGLVYICKKLSLTNVINLVPFLEGIINVLGFMVIGINCLISIIDVSYGNFSCEANSITLPMMTVCGTNMILIQYQLVYQSSSLQDISHFASCHLQDALLWLKEQTGIGLELQGDWCYLYKHSWFYWWSLLGLPLRIIMDLWLKHFQSLR